MDAETPNGSSTNGEEKSHTNERQNRLLDSFKLPENHWNDVGFRCALHHIDPSQEFNKVLGDYKNVYKELKSTLYHNHKTELGRFYEKINRARAKVKKISEDLKTHKNVSDLLEEIETLRANIETLDENLVTSYKNLGDAKKNLIQDQIDQVFADLDKITERYNTVSEQHNLISEKAKERNAGSLGIKPDFLKDLRDTYKKIHNDLNHRLTELSKSGISFISRTRLIGYGATLAAGWFFSVFALENKISNNDVPFFLLKGLFEFGSKLGAGASFGISLLYHVLFVAAALLTVFLISYLSYKLMDKTEKRQMFSKFFYKAASGESNNNKNSDDDPQNSDDKQLAAELSSANPHLTSKAFFTFWLESLPFLAIFGIAFIIISLSNIAVSPTVVTIPPTPDLLTSLNTSLSAQTVGTSLAIGCGGLAYLYIINIIEPRLEKKRGSARRWIWLNIELAAVILTIITFLMVLLFQVQNLYYGSNKSLFSLSMFIVCVLISSMVLGYGSYYLGLIETVSYTEEKMQKLSILAAYNSFPNIRLVMRADKTFRKAYIDLVEKLFKLELNKTKLAEEFFPSDDQAKERQQRNYDRKDGRKSPFWKAVVRFFSSPAGNDPNLHQAWSEQKRKDEEDLQIENRFGTLPQDKEYFPRIVCEIETLKGRRKSLGNRLIELEADLKSRNEDSSPYALKVQKEIGELEKQRDDWLAHVSMLLDIQLKEKNLLFQKKTREIAQMQDGFDLGRWMTENGIGPVTPPHLPLEDKNEIMDQ